MSILDKVKDMLPKRKPANPKENLPKEKEQMRRTFGFYCNKNHGTTDEKLCPKCTALLSTVMLKIARCPYGFTKPLCDKCEIMCFGPEKNKEFMNIMKTATSSSMLMKHPMTAMKHKLAQVKIDMGKQQAEMEKKKQAEAKEKNAKEKAKAKEEAAKNGTEAKSAVSAPAKTSKKQNKKKK